MGIGMDWNGLEWIGVDWNGLEWIGVDRNGLEWIGAPIPYPLSPIPDPLPDSIGECS